MLSYKWKQPYAQHINVLELTAVLSELRRRSRDQSQHNHRFFCIVDSLVTFYVFGKGRSSSKRLNRICRRVTALTLASGLIPVSLWTISKWNFSDGSRPDHLRFLGITAKTRRSMNKQSRHFSFIFAPYGADCQNQWSNWMRN